MEKLRYANTKLRPIWNGLTFYLLPRTLTFVGYQFRSLSAPTAPIIMNGIFASIILIALVVFFVMLVSQIKKINSRYEYLEDSRFDIGLARRYDYYRDFELDCISFSVIYFPALNYFRLFFAFACIGAAPDFHYLQYGMIILTQSFFFLSHISTSSYFRLRDRLFYTFSEFAILILIICNK